MTYPEFCPPAMIEAANCSAIAFPVLLMPSGDSLTAPDSLRGEAAGDFDASSSVCVGGGHRGLSSLLMSQPAPDSLLGGQTCCGRLLVL